MKTGQVVCFTMTRSGYFLTLLIGCIELGLILVPIDEDRNEIKTAIYNLRPRLVLHTSEFLLKKEEIPTRVEVLPIELFME